MSHTANYNQLYITSSVGLSIEEVRKCVGAPYRDLGMLCADKRKQGNSIVDAGRLNPWARYKPIRHSNRLMVLRTLELSSLGLGNIANYNRTSSVFSLPYATTVQGLLDLYADGDSNLIGSERANGWRYLKPAGLAYNERYRKFDFLKIESSGGVLRPVQNAYGYDKTATNPFGSFTCDPRVCRKGGIFGGYQDARHYTGDAPDTYITLTDFNDLLSGTSNRMLYYGMLLVPITSQGAWDSSYSAKLIATDDSSRTIIAQGSGYRGGEDMQFSNFALNENTWLANSYRVFPFLTNTQFPTGKVISVNYSNKDSSSVLDGRRMYPLPGSAPIDITVFDDNYAIAIYAGSASALGSGYVVDAYYTITNNSNSPISISDLTLKWRSVSSFDAPRAAGETFYTKDRIWDDTHAGTADNTMAAFLADQTLAAGDSVRVPAAPLSNTLGFSNAAANQLFIGFTLNGVSHYSSRTIRVPVNPSTQ